MKPCISLLAAFLVSMICLGDAAPLSTSNEESLAEVLRKSNLLLDRLLAGIPGEDKDKQDFEVELNERQNMDSIDDRELEQGKWIWNTTGEGKWEWVRGHWKWVWNGHKWIYEFRATRDPAAAHHPKRSFEDAEDDTDEVVNELEDREVLDRRNEPGVQDSIDDRELEQGKWIWNTGEGKWEWVLGKWTWVWKGHKWIYEFRPNVAPKPVDPERSFEDAEDDTDEVVNELEDREVLDRRNETGVQEPTKMKGTWKWKPKTNKWVWVVDLQVPAKPKRSFEDEQRDLPDQNLLEKRGWQRGKWIWKPTKHIWVWDEVSSAKISFAERSFDDDDDDDSDGHLPYEQKDDDDGEQVDEVSLKEAIRWLQELREARKQETQ